MWALDQVPDPPFLILIPANVPRNVLEAGLSAYTITTHMEDPEAALGSWLCHGTAAAIVAILEVSWQMKDIPLPLSHSSITLPFKKNR